MVFSDEQVLARFPTERIDQDDVGCYRGLLACFDAGALILRTG